VRIFLSFLFAILLLFLILLLLLLVLNFICRKRKARKYTRQSSTERRSKPRKATKPPKPELLHIDDISEGREQVPIECVNVRSDERPEPFEYISTSIIHPSIGIRFDVPFVCCSCTDGCQGTFVCSFVSPRAAHHQSTDIAANISPRNMYVERSIADPTKCECIIKTQEFAGATVPRTTYDSNGRVPGDYPMYAHLLTVLPSFLYLNFARYSHS
jgi:hypothetical protein